jgi:hypothetical protein
VRREVIRHVHAIQTDGSGFSAIHDQDQTRFGPDGDMGRDEHGGAAAKRQRQVLKSGAWVAVQTLLIEGRHITGRGIYARLIHSNAGQCKGHDVTERLERNDCVERDKEVGAARILRHPDAAALNRYVPVEFPSERGAQGWRRAVE